MKRVLALKQKVGELKPITFSDDEGCEGENTAASDVASDGESCSKDSRSRRGSGGRKRSRSSSEESAEDSGASSSSTSSKGWRSDASMERSAKEAKDNRGVGFEGSQDGSPPPRRRRRFSRVSSSSSSEEDSSQMEEGAKKDGDSLESQSAERSRMVDELFKYDEGQSSSSPQNDDVDDDELEEDDEKGDSAKGDLGEDVVVAVANKNEAMFEKDDAKDAAGFEVDLTASHGGDGRPSLANHPDVSRPEFSNES